MIFELVHDFANILAEMPTDHPRHRLLKLLDEAIRRDVYFIDRHPTAVFQCLWNFGHWHNDQPGDMTRDGQKTKSLPGLVAEWRAQKRVSNPDWLWCRALLPPAIPLESGIRFRLDGTAVGVTGDGRILLERRQEATHSYLFVDGKGGQVLEDLGNLPFGAVDCRAISWDGQQIVSATHILYRSTAPAQRLTDSPYPHLTAAKFDRETKCLCTGDDQGRIRVYDLSQDTAPILAWEKQIGDNFQIADIAISMDGSMIAAVSGKSLTVCKRSGVQVRCSHAPDPRNSTLFSVCFSSDGSRVFTGDGYTIRSWNLSMDSPSEELFQAKCRVQNLDVSEDGELLACQSNEGVAIFNLRRKIVLSTLQGHARGTQRIHFLPNSNNLVTAGKEEAMSIVWDRLLDNQPTHSDVTGGGYIVAKTLSADGNTIWLTRYNRGCLFHTTDGRFEEAAAGTIQRGEADDHSGTVATPYGADIKLIPLSAPKTETLLSSHQKEVTCVSFSPDGRLLASGSRDLTVRFWDLGKKCELKPRITVNEFPIAIAWSSDGELIAVVEYGNRYSIWHKSGVSVTQSKIHQVNDASYVNFSADGKRLFIGTASTSHSRKYIEEYQIPEGQLVCRIEGRSSQAAVQAFGRGMPFLPANRGQSFEIQTTHSSIALLGVSGAYHDFLMSADGLTFACFSKTDVAAYRLEGSTIGLIEIQPEDPTRKIEDLSKNSVVRSAPRLSTWDTTIPQVRSEKNAESTTSKVTATSQPRKEARISDIPRPREIRSNVNGIGENNLPLPLYYLICAAIVIICQTLILVFGTGLKTQTVIVQPLLYLLAYLIAFPAAAITLMISAALKNVPSKNWPARLLVCTPAIGALWLFYIGHVYPATPVLAILLPAVFLCWNILKKRKIHT
ncbi:WD40 repeat domain-containing protein [uncultured Rubinisphaera sp.]|uniref:WD40 repeat domain-containing protein n=1 Tax=uncultured Rubinisphaera sp. TaxID=1678686 RepID=UPI0030DD8188